MFQQVFHDIIEFALEVLKDARIVVLGDVFLDEHAFSFFSSLSLLDFRELWVRSLAIFCQIIVEICIALISSTPDSIKSLLILDIVEESDDDAAEEHSAHSNAAYLLEQELVCKKTFFEALVQEIWMVSHHVVDRFDWAELGFEFEEIRLKNFNLHVVHVVLYKLIHSMAQCICLLQSWLHIALFCRLVLQPSLL